MDDRISRLLAQLTPEQIAAAQADELAGVEASAVSGEVMSFIDSGRSPGHRFSASVWRRRDEWVLELTGTIDDVAFNCRHIQPGDIAASDVPGLPSLYAPKVSSDVIYAVARAWASIDGKLELFLRCQKDSAVEGDLGHYEGYLADARSLIERSQLAEFLVEGAAPKPS